MKLFPTDPEVDLYNEGFGDTDFLGRKAVSRKLSALVDSLETPVVIALDGAWGTGETHFLRRWVGADKLENEGKAQTIFFDAFQHDYLEDPLFAITGSIGSRVDEPGTKSKWTGGLLPVSWTSS
ncbi:P-loop NTPase fold protein [Rhizobium leguminosarum]|uniref:P-loop NTPase fold protein n=1 Tax=Rhizobium leguminosarum TaxID=384 RepID=UPI0036DB094C